MAGIGWFMIIPEEALRDFGRKLKSILVLCRENKSDPYWAMKLLKKYASYHRMAAEDRGVFFIYIIGERPDRKGIYVNILE